MLVFACAGWHCSVPVAGAAQVYPSGLVPVRLGEVKPCGWIREQMRADLRDGYVTRFDQLTPMATQDLFGPNKATYDSPLPSLAQKTWWAAEIEAHWMDALTRLAFLTGDRRAKSRARRWVDHVLAHQGVDGYLGIYVPELRFNHEVENGELWASSRALLVLLAHYEFTGDIRCLQAVKKAVGLTMSQYGPDRPYFKPATSAGGFTHGLAYADVLEWLNRLTGDKSYQSFAVFLYDNYSRQVTENTDLCLQNLLDARHPLQHHGAHIAEQFMVPFFVAEATGLPDHHRACSNLLEKMRFHLTPGGSLPSVESVRGKPGTADALKEYCTFNEFVRGFHRVVMMTGDTEPADWLERIVLNAAQGARLHPALTACAYCSSDSRLEISPTEHGGRLMYSACHGAAPCCAMSAARLMSYFVESLWLRRDGAPGLVAMHYGPCELATRVGAVRVAITEETAYPFSDEVIFRIKPERPTEFTLSLRQPEHADRIEISGVERTAIVQQDGFLHLRKRWKKSDTVRARFVWPIRKVAQPESATVSGKSGGYYLQRGPLVFSLPFPHELAAIKTFGDTGFANYMVTTKDRVGWDYAVDPNEPFELVRVAKPDLDRPWNNPPVFLKSRLVDAQGESRPVKLSPLGSTILRRVVFPAKTSSRAN